jgi:hypothetical protein
VHGERQFITNISGIINLNYILHLVKMIKIVRLKWLGHIARMEDNALPCKKITFCQPEGRPKLRWLDSVLKDLKILTVTAQDRDLWSKMIKEAKAHKGL